MTRPRQLPAALRDWVEIVVQDNAGDVLRYLRRRTGNPEDAADLLGKVLLALWEAGGKVPTTDEGARMWCFGIARNVVREYYRHGVKHTELASALRDRMSEIAARGNAADDAAESAMKVREIRDALGALDARSRELVVLLHWDGFSIAEAARHLGMNESTARTRYSRARQRLATLVAPPESVDAWHTSPITT
ncbi:sigma-70 family RNA polymerase sigma factor [Cryobacterium sp. BB307]|uniref:RNA polymerase sigma factor n=1 Tax=Cryobacterium sp. BB307 TaxID=2716317 RepID=UPI0014458AD9|nr:sigma-70 family RNA polymerase sigma factor [Cryobacterium sp. BB307]